MHSLPEHVHMRMHMYMHMCTCACCKRAWVLERLKMIAAHARAARGDTRPWSSHTHTTVRVDLRPLQTSRRLVSPLLTVRLGRRCV